MHTKSPRDSDSGAFLFPLCRQGLAPRLVAVVSLIEPFADAIGDHASHDGEDKRDSNHAPPLSIAMSRGGNASSIAYRTAKMNPRRTASLTDEGTEADLASCRADLLAERRARSASEDGSAKRA